MSDVDDSRDTTERYQDTPEETIPSESLQEGKEAPDGVMFQQDVVVAPPVGGPFEIPPEKHRRKGLRIAAIILAFLIVAAAGTGAYLYLSSKASSLKIVASIEERDGKLTERAKDALAITSTLKLSDALDETNAVMTERTALISEIGQQTSRWFQDKFDVAKSTMIAENERLDKDRVSRLRKELEPLVDKDNVVLGDMFLISSETSTLSWKEAFDTIDKSVADRVALINTIKLMPTLKYASQLSGYVALLNAENDFCRTYGRYYHALFDFSVQIDYYLSSYYADYDDVTKAKSDAADALKEFNTKYAALLKQDKAFWPTATAILPARNLEESLAQFYKNVNSTLSTGKT